MKKKYMDEEEDEDEDDDDDVPRKTPSDASFAPPVRRMCVFAPSVREAHVCVCPHARPHICKYYCTNWQTLADRDTHTHERLAKLFCFTAFSLTVIAATRTPVYLK